MRIEIAIMRLKAKLVKKAKAKGLYENFGQAEVRKLKDKYALSCKNPYDKMHVETCLQDFSDWCSTYDGRSK